MVVASLLLRRGGGGSVRLVRSSSSSTRRRRIGMEILSVSRDARGAETCSVRLPPDAGPGGPRHRRRANLLRRDDGRWTTDDGFEFGGGDDPLAVALRRGSNYAWDDAAAPCWPSGLRDGLRRAPLVGPGTVCFDAGRFGEIVAGAGGGDGGDCWPVVFPGASRRLGVASLRRLEALAREGGFFSGGVQLREAMRNVASRWSNGGGGDGSGRLVAEHASGELAQVGEGSIWEQLLRATGTGSVRAVVARADGPIGISFAPATHDDRGAEVMEVEPGSAAWCEGVGTGMTLTHVQGASVGRELFECILGTLDGARDRDDRIELRFATALDAERYYAVECPVTAIPALSVQHTAGRFEEGEEGDVASEFLCALDEHRSGTSASLVWREAQPRSFVGDPGSMTCVHADTIPQLQFAHGIHGTKMLGVASLGSTPRILRAHSRPEEETRVPVHSGLCAAALDLLSDPHLSVAVLQAGDAVAFSSAAAHFSTNGAASPSAAVYHGALTEALFDAAEAAAIEEGIELR